MRHGPNAPVTFNAIRRVRGTLRDRRSPKHAVSPKNKPPGAPSFNLRPELRLIEDNPIQPIRNHKMTTPSVR